MFSGQDLVHRFGPLGQHRPQLVPVHGLGHLGALVPNQLEICLICTPLALSNDTKLCPAREASSPPRLVQVSEQPRGVNSLARPSSRALGVGGP
jgi:hypothetical protein